VRGWGGRDRTSEWRNQNPLDYSAISRRIWKKWSKHPLAIPITWQPFPNKEAALAEDQSRKISTAMPEFEGELPEDGSPAPAFVTSDRP
jgi:hypothetical protein